jgi:ectoine hydroxylase-related dioxygenase (phytanoyl-CoA dioxygenase family)
VAATEFTQDMGVSGTGVAVPGVAQSYIDGFRRDGVVCLRAAFDQDWIERMQSAVDRRIEAPGDRQHDLSGGKPGRYLGENFLWLSDSDFEAFIRESPAAALAGQLLESRRIFIYHDTILVKEPGAEAPTPWHQDLPYYPLGGRMVCSIWFALDPVTLENGAVEYVRRSHLQGSLFSPEPFGSVGERDPSLPPIGDIESERDRFDIVSFDLVPGDCVVHHGLTVHGAPGNSSTATRRRALVSRWLGDDIVYRPGLYSDRHPQDCGLSDGDPIRCEMFSEMWARPATKS